MSEPTTNPRPDHHHQPAARRPGTADLTDTTADNRDADRHEATSTPASPARRDGQGGTGRPADRRRRRNGHTDCRPRSNILSDRQQGNRAAGILRPSAHRRHLHSSSRRRCVRCQRAAVTQVKAASFEKRDISRIEATGSRTPVLQNSQRVLALQHVRLRKTDHASVGSIGPSGPFGVHLSPVNLDREARRPPFAKLRFGSIPGEVKATASRWTVDQRASSRPFSIFKMSASASPVR